jgi:hypothetical protein
MNVDLLTPEEVNSLIRTDMYTNFKHYFDAYLISNYGINEEEFRQMIKENFAETFV